MASTLAKNFRTQSLPFLLVTWPLKCRALMTAGREYVTIVNSVAP